MTNLERAGILPNDFDELMRFLASEMEQEYSAVAFPFYEKVADEWAQVADPGRFREFFSRTMFRPSWGIDFEFPDEGQWSGASDQFMRSMFNADRTRIDELTRYMLFELKNIELGLGAFVFDSSWNAINDWLIQEGVNAEKHIPRLEHLMLLFHPGRCILKEYAAEKSRLLLAAFPPESTPLGKHFAAVLAKPHPDQIRP